MNKPYLRKPEWLKVKIPIGEAFVKVKSIVEDNHLHTICTSGKCPNIAECWTAGTATFMILGDICTRSCKFCNVKTAKPLPPDPNEPSNLALSVQKMKLKHCVITSVDRDDLSDGGANHWKNSINAVKGLNPKTTIEILIPDFQNKEGALGIVLSANADVVSHNLETVERLSPLVRNKAKYAYSLEVLRQIALSGTPAKSGIMLGLGETENEIYKTMDDLLNVGVSIFTIGQYLQPNSSLLPVEEYISPEIFDKYKNIGLSKGFLFVESSPLVRSSYHAEKHLK